MIIEENKFKDILLKKFLLNNFKVGIIGMGYVGLPLSLTFCKKKINVIGFDINEFIVNSINNGKSYINHIDSNLIDNYVKNSYLIASNNFKYIKDVDIIIICVPTPLNKNKEPELKYIINSLNSIKKFLKKGQLISLESTTYPGTTDEIIKPFLIKENFDVGKDFFVVYSPEREDPGNKTFNTNNTPKIVSGCTSNCAQVGQALYQKITKKVILLSSTKAAEMTKLLENIHRAVNIGLVNELKPIAESFGIDLYEVIQAAATKPFGFTPFYPGPGLGGHCIPIDPFYLTWKAREFGIKTKFIELAGEINSSMPKYVITKISESLNNICKSVKESKILILGISYKKNIDDARESPSLEIIKLLLEMEAKIEFNDPYFSKIPKSRNYDLLIKKTNLNKKNLIKFDCVVLLTDHDLFDYDLIKQNSKLIIDTRGKFTPSSNIIRA